MSGTLRGEIWRLSLAVAHSDVKGCEKPEIKIFKV